MGLNRELLRRTAQSIRSEEQMKYRQGSFFRTLYDHSGVKAVSCGTVGCVAGHAILAQHGMEKLLLVDRGDTDGSIFHRTAEEVLGLSEYQGNTLFSSCPSVRLLADAFNVPLERMPCPGDFPHGGSERFGICTLPTSDFHPEWMAAVLEAIAEHGS